MSADGHIVIARAADFREANPGVEPGDIGLYVGDMLGVQACWGYYGLFEPNYLTRHGDSFYAVYEATPEQTEARFKAADWFDANAESHEVWR